MIYDCSKPECKARFRTASTPPRFCPACGKSLTQATFAPYHVVVNEGNQVDTVAVLDTYGRSAFADIDGETNISGDDHTRAFMRAHMFAAAPEMLSLLTECYKALHDVRVASATPWEPSYLEKQIEDVIAKATGRAE
jgi:hypothetical protein